MRTDGKSTIKDVAKLAGVGIATVSRVINGNYPVSDAVCAAVWAAIDSLGYRPNVPARSLKTRKSRMVGVVVADLSNLFFMQLVKGLEAELSRLHRKLATTIVYVTHDQVEAMTMGSKIVIMQDGVIQQVGSPLSVYRRPANQFVAGFIGSPAMNFVEALLVQRQEGLYVEAPIFRVPVPEPLCAPFACLAGREVVFGIRPEDIHSYALIKDQAGSHQPICRLDAMVCGEVEVVEPLGPELLVFVGCGGRTLVVRLDPRLEVRVGQKIELVLDLDHMHLFAAAPPHQRIAEPDGQ